MDSQHRSQQLKQKLFPNQVPFTSGLNCSLRTRTKHSTEQPYQKTLWQGPVQVGDELSHRVQSCCLWGFPSGKPLLAPAAHPTLQPMPGKDKNTIWTHLKGRRHFLHQMRQSCSKDKAKSQNLNVLKTLYSKATLTCRERFHPIVFYF